MFFLAKPVTLVVTQIAGDRSRGGRCERPQQRGDLFDLYPTRSGG